MKQQMEPIHALRKSTRPRKQSQRMLDGAEDDESPPMKKPCKSLKLKKHPRKIDICKNGNLQFKYYSFITCQHLLLH